MVRYQTQAVLRRTSRTTPLKVVGVTLDSTFFPGSAEDATGPLTLDKGLVALAPLSAVDARGAAEAATSANLDAMETWSGVQGPEQREP